MNTVNDVPEAFKQWVSDNSDRLNKAEAKGSVPYFIKDNKETVERIRTEKKEASTTTIAGNSKQISPTITQPTAASNVFSKSQKVLKQNQYESELPDNLTDDEKYLRVSKGERNSKETITKLFNIDDVEGKFDYVFEHNPISQFDLIEFDKELQSIVEYYGGDITKRELEIITHGNTVTMSYVFKPIGSMKRTFYEKDGMKIVSHDVLKIVTKYQGKGISKEILKSLYKGYENAGINKIELYANIDIGGYAWARYGFSFTDGEKYLLNLIKNQGKINNSKFDEAISIVENYYKENIKTDPFPMNLLTGYNWSKDLLLGTGWEGELILQDALQTDIFKNYLGI